MYAVIETGGKQYRVEVGTELAVELLDVEPGKTVTFERVLLVADGDTTAIGRPIVDGAAVSAEVVRQTRGEKVISFKYRPKARSRVKKGHRQELTVLRINDITLGGKSAAASVAKAASDKKTERQRIEEAAVAQAAKDAELAAKLATPSAAATTKAATTKAATTKPAAKAPATKAAATKTPAAKKPAATKATTKTAATKPAEKPAAKTATSTAKATTAGSSATPAAPAKSAPKRATKKDE